MAHEVFGGDEKEQVFVFAVTGAVHLQVLLTVQPPEALVARSRR